MHHRVVWYLETCVCVCVCLFVLGAWKNAVEVLCIDARLSGIAGPAPSHSPSVLQAHLSAKRSKSPKP